MGQGMAFPPVYQPGISSLPNWNAKCIARASRKVVFWGDSTTSNATGMFGSAAQPTVSGGEFGNFYSAAGEVLDSVTCLNYGNNGATLAVMATPGGVTYSITEVISANPDLIVLCAGINDVRLGATSQAQFQALIASTINTLRQRLPTADIVLWGPNAFLSDDPTSSGFVSPLASAQAYSTALYNAYAAFSNVWPNVVVLQKQDILGKTCQPSSVAGPGNANGWMTDILHPNATIGQVQEASQLASLIGYRVSFSSLQASVARGSNAASPFSVYTREVEDPSFYDLVATGRFNTQGGLGTNGFLDFNWPGPQAANISAGDVVQCGYGGSSFVIASTASILNQTSTVSRLSNLGASLPPSMSGGTVNVWRPKYCLDSLGNIKSYVAQTANFPSRRRYVVADGGANYVRVRAIAGDAAAWPTTFASGDTLILPGLAPITVGSPSQSNTSWVQYSPTGSFAAYIGQQCLMFSTTAGRS